MNPADRKSLMNKTAFGTGGSRGIGAAIAKSFARDGAHVVITYAKDSKSSGEVVRALEILVVLNPASSDWAAPQLATTSRKRYGHVDEVAALVAFVASPEASYITGANLTVDGGINA